MSTSSTSSSSYWSCTPESINPEFSSSSSNAAPLSPVDPSTPDPYPEAPEIDPEFLDIWYQENYFKVDAHDRAQIQLEELVAKWFNKHGYSRQEVHSLETLISLLHAYIEYLDAKLKEFDVDVGEPPSGEVPGSAPSGRKGAFFVIEQQKRQLGKASNEIHQLKDYVAHLEEELTNVINSQSGVSGPFTSTPGQMDGQKQQNVEAKKAAIARLTEEHEYLQAQLNELNIFVMVAGEYIQEHDVEVERLKEEIGGIHVCADQLRQQVEGSSPAVTFTQPGSQAIVPDSRIARTFNKPPVNRTFQATPSTVGSPVDQNQIAQLPLPDVSQNQMSQGPLAVSPIRQNQLPLSDASPIGPGIRKSTVSSENDSIQSRHDSLYSPGMDRTYSGAERDNSYETSYEDSYIDNESSKSSLDPNGGPGASPIGKYQIPQSPLAASSPLGWNRFTRPGTRSPTRMTYPPPRMETKDTIYSPPSRNQTFPRTRKSTVSSEDDGIQSRHDSLYSPGMDRTYSGAERDNSYETSYEGSFPDYYLSEPSLDPDESYPSDVFILPGESLEGEALEEVHRRDNRFTHPRLLKPRRRNDSIFGRSIGPLNRTSERDSYSYSDSWQRVPYYSPSSEDSSWSEDSEWNDYLRAKGSLVKRLQGKTSPSPPPTGTPPRSSHNTTFKKTVMLQSPSREVPLLLDIDVQPRPIIETASGEHVVCDITLDMIEPAVRGLRPISHREPPILESNKRPGLQTPRGVSWIQTASPQLNRTYDVPPQLNKTFEVSPRMNRTF